MKSQKNSYPIFNIVLVYNFIFKVLNIFSGVRLWIVNFRIILSINSYILRGFWGAWSNNEVLKARDT